jgi:hypothetical protein
MMNLDAGGDTGVKPDSGHDAGHDSGHDAGHDAGHDSGHSSGGDSGHSSGSDSGHDAGHDAGHDSGHDAGHDSGLPSDFDASACSQPLPPCTGENTININYPAACIAGGVNPYGFYDQAQCVAICPSASRTLACDPLPSPVDGGMAILQCTICIDGRAYEGMERPTTEGQTSALGRYFAEAAQVEAASVHSFRILRDELRAHAAPADLVLAAEVAARDEVRHARMTRRLARRYGPCTPHARVGKRPVRPLEAVARENAVEGCVRETYAAMLAHHQAMAATDPEVREAMSVIAEDETRHALLAWRVAAWADARLDDAARGRIAAARAAAVHELRRAIANEKLDASLTDVAGLPSAERAVTMLAMMEHDLWQAQAHAA